MIELTTDHLIAAIIIAVAAIGVGVLNDVFHKRKNKQNEGTE